MIFGGRAFSFPRGLKRATLCLDPTPHRFFSSLLKDDAHQERTIEERYSVKSQVEHVLLRPAMYVGPVSRVQPSVEWVLASPPPPLNNRADDKALNFAIVRREYAPAPALIKIFDEILVNASDNRMRNPETCTRIDVTINPGSESNPPEITIFNDGNGIPIQMHKHENLYVPELLFGKLLSGSNFDDDEKRVTGGRHGFGAKLTNIFSKKFLVETVDSSRGLRYQQTWYNNMQTMEEPTIEKTSESDYTRVTFVPDLPRLTGLPNARILDEQDYAAMCRRVVDIAGCARGELKVTLNGFTIPVPSFEAYSYLYRNSTLPPLCYMQVNDRWEVAVGSILGDKKLNFSKTWWKSLVYRCTISIGSICSSLAILPILSSPSSPSPTR